MQSVAFALASSLFFVFVDKVLSPRWSKRLPRFQNFSKLQQSEWHSRITSTVHSATVTFFVLYVLFFDDNLKQDPVWGISTISELTVAFTTGFLIADLFLMITDYEGVGGTLTYVLHHSTSIFAYLYALWEGVLISVAIFRLLAEMSTTFVNLRWCMSNAGYKNSSLYFYNGVVMTLTFFIARVLPIPFFYYHAFYIVSLEQYARVTWVCHVTWIGTCVILDIMNVVWFRKMIAGVRKHLFSGSPVKPIGPGVRATSDGVSSSTTTASAFGGNIAHSNGDVTSFTGRLSNGFASKVPSRGFVQRLFSNKSATNSCARKID